MTHDDPYDKSIDDEYNVRKWRVSTNELILMTMIDIHFTVNNTVDRFSEFVRYHKLDQFTDIGFRGYVIVKGYSYCRFWFRDPSMAVLAKLWM